MGHQGPIVGVVPPSGRVPIQWLLQTGSFRPSVRNAASTLVFDPAHHAIFVLPGRIDRTRVHALELRIPTLPWHALRSDSALQDWLALPEVALSAIPARTFQERTAIVMHHPSHASTRAHAPVSAFQMLSVRLFACDQIVEWQA